MKQCGAGKVDRGNDPLEAVVDAYLRTNAAAQAVYLDYYRRQPSLELAVEKAAMAAMPDGSRFCHQVMVKIPAMKLARGKLGLIDFNRLGLRSFAELLDRVRREILPISGIGPLTVYDTAHRLGAYLGLRPEKVYIHAGVKYGVLALGINAARQSVEMTELPPAFKRLTPEQAEDCLCIYASELRWAARECWNLGGGS